MDQIRFTIATLKDIEQLVALEMQCFDCDCLTAKQFRYYLKRKTAIVAVAKEKNAVIGSGIVVLRKNSTNARCYTLAVSPLHQRKGVAQHLLRYIEESCLAKNYSKLILEVKIDNLKAINFYFKNGYVNFGLYKAYYSDKTDALRMCKMLNNKEVG